MSSETPMMPDTSRVRAAATESAPITEAEFDRWLTEHDAEVLWEAALELERRMQDFPLRGRHVRAGWAVAVLRSIASATSKES